MDRFCLTCQYCYTVIPYLWILMNSVFWFPFWSNSNILSSLEKINEDATKATGVFENLDRVFMCNARQYIGLRSVDRYTLVCDEQLITLLFVFQEQCEPINAAISTAMENVVVVVESLTKAKQITGGVLKSCHKRSSCSSRNSSSANSFPRTSGWPTW